MLERLAVLACSVFLAPAEEVVRGRRSRSSRLGRLIVLRSRLVELRRGGLVSCGDRLVVLRGGLVGGSRLIDLRRRLVGRSGLVGGSPRKSKRPSNRCSCGCRGLLLCDVLLLLLEEGTPGISHGNVRRLSERTTRHAKGFRRCPLDPAHRRLACVEDGWTRWSKGDTLRLSGHLC